MTPEKREDHGETVEAEDTTQKSAQPAEVPVTQEVPKSEEKPSVQEPVPPNAKDEVVGKEDTESKSSPSRDTAIPQTAGQSEASTATQRPAKPWHEEATPQKAAQRLLVECIPKIMLEDNFARPCGTSPMPSYVSSRAPTSRSQSKIEFETTFEETQEPLSPVSFDNQTKQVVEENEHLRSKNDSLQEQNLSLQRENERLKRIVEQANLRDENTNLRSENEKLQQELQRLLAVTTLADDN